MGTQFENVAVHSPSSRDHAPVVVDGGAQVGVLVGRGDEQRSIDRVLDAARFGLSGALVLNGDPGTGKSALLEYAIQSARDFEVVAVSGAESEMDWGFSGLERLLRPLLPRLERMRGEHLDDLRAALGLIDDPRPDRVGAALGALELMSEVANDRPLLCVVDDAQWLDSESIDALLLVARRMHADRVGIVFATRPSVRDLVGIPALHIRGLDDDDAAELLRRTTGVRFDAEIARQVVVETEGVPLAILEVAAVLGPAGLAREAPSPEPLPVAGKLRAHFLRTVRALPDETQVWLLVGAADRSGDSTAVGVACDRLGIARTSWEPARQAGILNDALDFRHPLIRSAVYSGASLALRRRVHRSLASAIDPLSDPDRHAWHLAAGSSGDDNEIASLLDAAATRSAAKGAPASAGRFLQRSAELTRDADQRVVRLLAAAEAYLVGGAPRRALALLDDEAARFADGFDRARADRLIGACRYALGEAVGTPTILMGAAKEFVPYDGALARSTLVLALAAGRVAGRFSAAGETYEDVARLASQILRIESPDSSAVDALIDANVTLFMRSHAEAVPAFRRAFKLLADGSDDSTDLLLWLSVGSWGCGALGEVDTLREFAERLVRLARGWAAPEALSQGLMWLGVTELISGSLVTADVHFTERVQLMSAIGRGSVDVGNMMVLALRGHEEAMRSEAGIVERHAVEHSIGWMLVFVEYSIAVLELGRGNYRAAFEAANLDYQDNPFLSMLSFPDLIEAASRADEPLAAAAALRQLEQRALASDTPYALGVLARSRALLAVDADDAERLYIESLDELSRCRAGFQTARTHLVFGEWLRRQKRRLEARSHLRLALSMFNEMGAEAFAERTRIELDATGEHSRRRVVDTMNELTAQELQIAHLVSVGATNSEVSSQLFISKSTVDYHLGKVYRKLGISSRRQLRTVLSPPIEPRTPPNG